MLGALRVLGGSLTTVIIASNLAACGETSSSSPTSSPTPSASPPASARYESTDPVAVALDQTLLTVADLPPPPATPVTTTARGRPVPQGPITAAGVIAVLPQQPAFGVAVQQSGALYGANRTYRAQGQTPPLVLDVLAIRFPNQQSGQTFAQTGRRLVLAGGGVATPHPEVTIGVQPVDVIRLPAPPTGAYVETDIAAVLYRSGFYYLVTVQGPPGTVSDAEMLTLLTTQDHRYQSSKDTLRSR